MLHIGKRGEIVTLYKVEELLLLSPIGFSMEHPLDLLSELNLSSSLFWSPDPVIKILSQRMFFFIYDIDNSYHVDLNKRLKITHFVLFNLSIILTYFFMIFKNKC